MKGKDLSSVLIMPIQRLPRYILLLQVSGEISIVSRSGDTGSWIREVQTIKEKHAQTAEEQEDLQQCIDLMKQATQYVNEEKKIAAQMAELQEIEHSLLHTEDHPVRMNLPGGILRHSLDLRGRESSLLYDEIDGW